MSTPLSTATPPSKPYLTCREMLDFVMAYLDDELPGDIRSEFERHLKVCPSCVNYLESYQRTIRLSKSVWRDLDEPAETEAPKALINAILASRTSPPKE